MPRPRSAKEASCESKIAVLLGFHLCESCLKLNEDCLKKFSDENSKEQLKDMTEEVVEFKLDKTAEGSVINIHNKINSSHQK